MRRIVTFQRVSADGYFASRDGQLDWTVPDEELDRAGAAATDRFDTVLYGRKTYEMFASFWPRALDDPKTTRDPHQAGRRTEALRAMAVMLNESAKIVFSKSMKEATWKGTRIVRDFDPVQIAAMKEAPGKDVIVFGSGTIVSLLAEHDLLDEIQLVVSPLLLGDGRPLVGGLSKRRGLDLVESKAYASGNVFLRYAPKG